MSCSYYINRRLSGEILRDTKPIEERTDISKQLNFGENVIEVIFETRDKIIYFETLFVNVNDKRIIIVKNLYLSIDQRFTFSIIIKDNAIIINENDPIDYDVRFAIEFIATGQNLDIAQGDFKDKASAAATKAGIEATTSNTVKYVLSFRTGMDSGIFIDYVKEDRMSPVLVGKV